MKPNVGKTDRIMRALIGLGLLSLLFVLEGNMRWWGLIGIVPLGTAIFRWCPAYVPFSINSSESEDS